MTALRRCIPAGLFLLLCLSFGRGEETEEPQKQEPPADGVVTLSQKQYEEQKAELERLRKLLKADVPMRPSECRLKGKLEAGRVVLAVTYTLVPERAGLMKLALGKKMPITRATLDGQPAPLLAEADGLYLPCAGPRREPHTLVVELTLPVQPRGSARSFEVELPGAAITHLSLDLPSGLKDLRSGDVLVPPRNQEFRETPLILDGTHLEGFLGPVERLQLSWREPHVVEGPMLLASRGTIEVVADEKQQLSITAALELQVESGRTSSWRLYVPPGAELKVATEHEARVARIDSNDDHLPFASLRTIQLKEATSEPLAVTVTVPRRPLPRNGRVPVGPFAVVGALRQTGTITLRSSARDLQIHPVPAVETTPRPPTPEEQKLASFVRGFAYDRVPLPTEKPKSATGPGSYSLLDLETESVRGVVETRPTHVVQLPPRGKDPEATRSWVATTTLKGRLLQPGVELLEVQLPPDAEYLQEDPPPRLLRPFQEVKYDDVRKVLQFRLDRDNWKEFTTTFRVRYQVGAGSGSGETALVLPRALDTERGGEFQVEVRVPDDLELIQPEKPNPSLQLAPQTSPHHQLWQFDPTAERLQEQVVVAWRPYRVAVQASTTAKVTLLPREARVVQEIRLSPARTNGGVLTFAVPEAIAPTLRVQSPWKVDPEMVGGKWSIKFAGAAGQEPPVVLDYQVPLAEETQPAQGRAAFVVPLIVLDQATGGETRVLVWSEPGSLPQPVGEGWLDQPPEIVAGTPRLPVLVLSRGKLAPDATLRYAEVQGKPSPVATRRALIRVLVQETGVQHYKASFVLQQVGGRTLDVVLPAPLASLNGLAFRLDGNQIDPAPVDEEGKPSVAGRFARLYLPAETLARPSRLDVEYQFAPRAALPFAAALYPPLLRDDPGRALVRWSISVPAGWVAVGPEEGPGSRRTWTRRGVLFVPGPAETAADLETWLAGTDLRPEAPPEFATSPALVCWRTGPEAPTVYALSQQIWLLLCSLVLLAVGLGFVFWWRRVLREEASAYPLLVGVLAALLVPAVLSLWFPTALAAIALGCEPGAVVLLLVVVVQWLAHERDRRRLTFLPSFSRQRTPSTVSRQPTPARQQTEPSTVDAPGTGAEE